MDPNATLEQIRDIVRVHYDDESYYTTLCDLIFALDQWLSHGGFKPIDWEF